MPFEHFQTAICNLKLLGMKATVEQRARERDTTHVRISGGLEFLTWDLQTLRMRMAAPCGS